MANVAGGLPVVKGTVVPDVFADEALCFECFNGTVRIGFSSVQMIEGAAPSEMQHVLIGRLVMPIESAQRMVVTLYSYLERMGHDPKEALGDVSDLGKVN